MGFMVAALAPYILVRLMSRADSSESGIRKQSGPRKRLRQFVGIDLACAEHEVDQIVQIERAQLE